jgi:hypothetical protein
MSVSLLIAKHCLSEESKNKAYLDLLDVLIDEEDDKYKRCEYYFDITKEPIEKLEEKHVCKYCLTDMLINEPEARAVCTCCGNTQPIFIFRQDYKDITYERTGYLYKRITHFRKHWRDLEKKIGMLRIDSYIDRAELMFKTIEPLFRKYKPPERRNFFNYQYILIKFFEIFNRYDIRKHLTYLKSKEKLEKHDDIWLNICNEMGWPFHKSKRIVEHRRKYRKRPVKKK